MQKKNFLGFSSNFFLFSFNGGSTNIYNKQRTYEIEGFFKKKMQELQ